MNRNNMLQEEMCMKSHLCETYMRLTTELYFVMVALFYFSCVFHLYKGSTIQSITN